MADLPVGRGRARSRTLQEDDLDFPDLDGASSDSSGSSPAKSSASSGSGSASPAGSAGSASSPAARSVSSKTQKALADGLRDPSMMLPMHDRFMDETTEEERMEAEMAEMDRLMAQKPAAAASARAGASAKDGRVTKVARAGDGAAPSYDLIIKLLMLGDSGVGKTSLLQRYARRKFDSKVLASAGVAYETQYVVVEGRTIRVDIWDTAGQERFHVITQAYYAGAHGIILAYDASDTSEASFDSEIACDAKISVAGRRSWGLSVSVGGDGRPRLVFPAIRVISQTFGTG